MCVALVHAMEPLTLPAHKRLTSLSLLKPPYSRGCETFSQSKKSWVNNMLALRKGSIQAQRTSYVFPDVALSEHCRSKTYP